MVQIQKSTAAKDNEVVKKGEVYYWWKLENGHIRLGKHPPRKSQTTSSDFLREVWTLQEDIEDAVPSCIQSLRDQRKSWVEQLDEVILWQYEYLAGMGDSHLRITAGPKVEKRIESLENWQAALNRIKLEDNESKHYLVDRLEEFASLIPDF